MKICSYCKAPEIKKGTHKPASDVEPITGWWYKIHTGHPNFPLLKDE